MGQAHNDWASLVWNRCLQHYCQLDDMTQLGMFTHSVSGTAYLVPMLGQELEVFQSLSPLSYQILASLGFHEHVEGTSSYR
jgi:hypothetical protein